jgi:hypothetical protein
VMITKAQKEARKESVARPRAVLRRNTVLPFNRTLSGWGAIASVETFRSAETPETWNMQTEKTGEHATQTTTTSYVLATRAQSIIRTSMILQSSSPQVSATPKLRSKTFSLQQVLQNGNARPRPIREA